METGCKRQEAGNRMQEARSRIRFRLQEAGSRRQDKIQDVRGRNQDMGKVKT